MKSLKQGLDVPARCARVTIVTQVGGDPFLTPNNIACIAEPIDHEMLIDTKLARRDGGFHQDQ
ncbi:MAG: hypothetical protein LAO55_09185 [Acidobacteriia bacterium]|nr:hypothetical protein [Terriglobia bacterium]